MTDVRDVLDSLGIHVTSQSRSRHGWIEYSARCPYHYGGTVQEHEPSWSINSDTGAHTCYSCGFRGSLEWLVHVKTGVSLEEAAQRTDKGGRALERLKRVDPWAGERPTQVVPMSEARILMYGVPPEWALKDRRLTAEAAAAYGVRWADTYLHGPSRTPYQDCWVTPIRQPGTLGLIGMQVKQEGGERFFRNVPGGVHKSGTLFGIELLQESGGGVVVVESPLDAVYLYRLGYSAVSTMGAAVSDDQMELLIQYADRIILALDDDKAGWKTTYRLLGMHPNGRADRNGTDYSARIPIWVANYDEAIGAKDPGEMPPPVVRAVLGQMIPAFRLQMRGVA